MSKPKKPDFICIGPEKTGTTLLYSVLNQHPDITLPQVKEIRYWNEGEYIPAHSILNLIISKHWHYRSLRSLFPKATYSFIRDFIRRDKDIATLTKQLLWKYEYIFSKRSLKWYERLFENSDKLTGDISPLYYHMSENRINELAAYNSKIKIIITIRDPIDRVWSKAKMNLMVYKKRTPSEISIDELKSFASEIFIDWTPYTETIKVWKKYFDDVHISLYDELVNHSSTWYEKILKFLGVDNTSCGLLNKKINKGILLEMPSELKMFLFEQYGPEIENVSKVYSIPNWKKKYEDYYKALS